MKEKLKHIESEIENMRYTRSSPERLRSLVEEAIRIVKIDSSNHENNLCLINLQQTFNKEIRDLFEPRISERDREMRFKEALTNFRLDLNHSC